MFLDPPHDDLLANGDLGARVILGESIALRAACATSRLSRATRARPGCRTVHAAGRPRRRGISIGLPQAPVTANGDTVVSDRPVALAPPRDTLHLEADLVSTVRSTPSQLLEDAGAAARAPCPTPPTRSRPPFPDTAARRLGGGATTSRTRTPIRAGVVRYTLRTVDRYGLHNDFNVVFLFFTQLRVSDNPLADNDAVTPTADLSLQRDAAHADRRSRHPVRAGGR